MSWMRPSSHLVRKERRRQQQRALKAAKELLALYDAMGGVSAGAYKRTYYDAFQVAVMSPCTIAGFINSARAMEPDTKPRMASDFATCSPTRVATETI